MWYAYPIFANFERQKQIIRPLRKWIQSLEERRLIKGFAFDHYFNIPNESDHLSIRFDYPNEDNLSTVRNELENKVRRLVPNYVLQERPWTANEEVLKAYEFGSRCAFLFWEKESHGRFPENYLSDFFKVIENQQLTFRLVPFNFQFHFNHGVMNSLGVAKRPNEQWIHLLALIESTGSHSPEELCDWIRKQPARLFQFFG